MRLGRLPEQLGHIGHAVRIEVRDVPGIRLRQELLPRASAAEDEQGLESELAPKANVLGQHITDHEHPAGLIDLVVLHNQMAQLATRLAQRDAAPDYLADCLGQIAPTSAPNNPESSNSDSTHLT